MENSENIRGKFNNTDSPLDQCVQEIKELRKHAYNDQQLIVLDSVEAILKRKASQPEPEESQKELWEEITAIILGSEDDMEITRNKIMKQFLIQRKK